VEPRFDMAYEFSEGMAAVILDKRTGYVNRGGELVIPPAFLWGRCFSDGLAAMNVGSGKAHKSIADGCDEDGFIDPQGDFVIPPAFLATAIFRDGLRLVETETDLMYIDRDGKPVWRGGWVELGDFDPLHLLPQQQ
jgi:WG containing repeat